MNSISKFIDRFAILILTAILGVIGFGSLALQAILVGDPILMGMVAVALIVLYIVGIRPLIRHLRQTR